jgi:hypothetical protein
MSGAAGIAAAKNRRSRTDPVRPSVVDCKTVNGACAPKKGNMQQQNRSIQLPTPTMENNFVDPISMKILGPMPINQILKIHEQRLNRFEEQLSQGINTTGQHQQQNIFDSNSEVNIEYKQQFEDMEDKIRMLEEVIMNLQLTITNVQGFAMETNLAMMKIKKTQEGITQDIPNKVVSQLTDTNIDVSIVPSSENLTDIVDTINNDEIVSSNITFTLNNSY